MPQTACQRPFRWQTMDGNNKCWTMEELATPSVFGKSRRGGGRGMRMRVQKEGERGGRDDHRQRSRTFLAPTISNSVLKPSLNQMLSRPLNSALSATLNATAKPILNPSANPILNPVVNPTRNPVLNPIVNPILNPMLTPVSNPHLSPTLTPILKTEGASNVLNRGCVQF